jgi:hypothetical protein
MLLLVVTRMIITLILIQVMIHIRACYNSEIDSAGHLTSELIVIMKVILIVLAITRDGIGATDCVRNNSCDGNGDALDAHNFDAFNGSYYEFIFVVLVIREISVLLV